MTAGKRTGFTRDEASTTGQGTTDSGPGFDSASGGRSSFATAPRAAPGGKAGSRAASLLPGASLDLALLNLASSASADLRFRRAESLLPCGLTPDELHELIGRCGDKKDSHADGASRAGGGSASANKAHLSGGLVVTAGGPAGLGGEPPVGDKRA